jgi:DEAD/DEAH box helicase
MMPGTLCPFNTLVNYQRFATNMSLNQAKAPATTVASDGSYIIYKDSKLWLHKWTNGLRRLYDDTWTLVKELFRQKELDLQIPDEVPDDMTNSQRGYSWLDNGKFIKDRALLQILMEDCSLQLCSRSHTGLIFRPQAMISIMDSCAAINRNLLVLLHALPGQPSRGSEFVEHKIRNSTRSRTLFRIHNALWLVTRRLKTENLTRREVFIPIKIPPELQTLLEFYLLAIRPVEIDLARKLYGDDQALLFHEFLFVQHGKKIPEESFSHVLQIISNDYFDCSNLRIRSYRHCVIGFARHFLGTEYDIEEDEDDALAQQAGHGPSIRRSIYAPQQGFLPSLTSDLINRYGVVSEWWWRLTKFYPGAPPLLPLQERRAIRGHMDDGLQIQPAHNEDEEHGTQVINPGILLERITAVIRESVTQIKVDLDAQIQASVTAAMAEFLARQTVNSCAFGQPQAASRPLAITHSNDNDIEDMYFNPPLPVDNLSTKSLELLHKLYPGNPDVSFKTPQQEQMVKMSLSRNKSFVAVLPTGGGKSLAFLLPALDDTNHLTLVVIPNKALLTDQLRKAKDLGIKACKWLASSQDIGDARLIFLALESATSPAFYGLVLFF